VDLEWWAVGALPGCERKSLLHSWRWGHKGDFSVSAWLFGEFSNHLSLFHEYFIPDVNDTLIGPPVSCLFSLLNSLLNSLLKSLLNSLLKSLLNSLLKSLLNSLLKSLLNSLLNSSLNSLLNSLSDSLLASHLDKTLDVLLFFGHVYNQNGFCEKEMSEI